MLTNILLWSMPVLLIRNMLKQIILGRVNHQLIQFYITYLNHKKRENREQLSKVKHLIRDNKSYLKILQWDVSKVLNLKLLLHRTQRRAIMLVRDCTKGLKINSNSNCRKRRLIPPTHQFYHHTELRKPIQKFQVKKFHHLLLAVLQDQLVAKRGKYRRRFKLIPALQKYNQTRVPW